MQSNGSQIQKGFFKRLISYITTKSYERKKYAAENYKLNWDQIKWRYRIGKILFLFGFYFTGKFLFVDKIQNKKFIEEEISKDRETIRSYLDRGLDQEQLEYKKILNKIKSSNANFFKIDLIENFDVSDENTKNIKQDPEIYTLYKITEELIEIFKLSKDNLYNIDKSSLDKLDLKSALKILKIRKKYDENNLDEDIANVIKYAEDNYKFLLTGSFIPNRVIQLSSNLLKEFSSIEEVAFVIAMNLYDFSNVNYINKKISREVIQFIDKAIEIENKNNFICFNEDLKLLKRDLINEKNISTVIKLIYIDIILSHYFSSFCRTLYYKFISEKI